jgi:proteasome lid subunit RPN8/RPN11
MFILKGFNLGRHTIAEGIFPNEGQPSSVTFTLEEALSLKDELVGFYHTHPNFSNHYSLTDKITMEGWVDMLGRPLWCLIDGINGLVAYLCFNLENEFYMVRFPAKRVKDYFTFHY